VGQFLQVRRVQGEAWRIGEKTLTPEARVVSLLRRRATIGTARTSGWGGGWVMVQPLAILETSQHGTRRIPIRDVTSRALRVMLLAALGILFVSILLSLGTRRR